MMWVCKWNLRLKPLGSTSNTRIRQTNKEIEENFLLSTKETFFFDSLLTSQWSVKWRSAQSLLVIVNVFPLCTPIPKHRISYSFRVKFSLVWLSGSDWSEFNLSLNHPTVSIDPHAIGCRWTIILFVHRFFIILPLISSTYVTEGREICN